MGASVIRTYRPIPSAVLPGSAVRGTLVGLLYVPLAILLFVYLDAAFEGTNVLGVFVELYFAIGLVGIMGIGFLIPFVSSLLLAFVGYGRRRYELGTDGITERRGLLLTKEMFVAYDDIEEVILTQSKIQSLYGTGTIRLADVDSNDDEERRMKLSFIESPGTVYTNILRNVSEPGGSGELETEDVGEVPLRSEDISRLSGDRLAAGTGFDYLMPSAILHPDPGEAAKYGGLLAVGYSLIGAVALFVLKPLVMWLVDIPSDLHFKAFVVLGAAAYMVVLGGWFYWKYDRRQYELYDDHIRFIDGGEWTTVALENVADLERREGTVPSNDVGHIALLEADGNDLLEFEFITEPEGMFESLEQWAGTAEVSES